MIEGTPFPRPQPPSQFGAGARQAASRVITGPPPIVRVARMTPRPPPEFQPPPPPPKRSPNDYSSGFVSGALTEPPRPTDANASGHYSFQAEDASDIEGAKVLIYDGLIGTSADLDVPDGMGGDDFTLSVSDGDEIYAVVTYDTDTFEITSRSLAAGETPDDTFGTLNIKLIDVQVVDNGGGSFTVLPSNAVCGDVIFNLHYVNTNGQLYVEAFCVFGSPMLVPDE